MVVHVCNISRGWIWRQRLSVFVEPSVRYPVSKGKEKNPKLRNIITPEPLFPKALRVVPQKLLRRVAALWANPLSLAVTSLVFVLFCLFSFETRSHCVVLSEMELKEIHLPLTPK